MLSFTTCDKTRQIKLEAKGQATIKFSVQPIKSDTNCFVLKVGRLQFNFTSLDISLFSSNSEILFNKKSIKKQSIQFNASSELDIWISINEMFIKFGTNFLSESNILYEFEPINQIGQDLFRSIDYIVIDNRFKLLSEPVQSSDSFYSNLSPLIKKDDYYEAFSQLSVKNQHLFSIIKDFNLTSDEFDSILYSLNSESCELNLKSGIISASIQNKYATPLLIEIWPHNFTDKLVKSFRSYGITKILKGNLNFKYDESPEHYLISESNILWMSPQVFNNYQVFKPSNDSLTVTVSSFDDLDFKADYSFLDLMNIVSNEYGSKRCNQSINLNNNQSISLSNFKFEAKVSLNGINLKTNSLVHGELSIEQIDDDFIQINGTVNGLSINAFHAIHIHESTETRLLCKDTGPHFNPLFSKEHGSPHDHLFNKHIGDLGNLETDSSGKAILYKRLNILTIKWRNVFNILYRTIVIHRDTDDLGRGNHVNSKSNGNSGPRIACGVILPIE